MRRGPSQGNVQKRGVVQAAFLLMLLARLAALAVGIVAFAATGRLLDPQDFGHFAVVLSAWMMLLSFSEFGLRSFLIRERMLAPGDPGRAIGLALALSVGAAALMALTALALPRSVADREVVTAALVLAPALVPATAAAVVEALLQRVMDFRLISRITVLRAGVDASVAVGLAAAGFGAVSLAAAVLTSHLAATAVLLARSGHAAALRPRIDGWSRFVPFGLRTSGTSLLPTATDFGLIAVLTALQGAAVAGTFNRAMTVHQMLDRVLLQGLQPVVLPAIAQGLAGGLTPAQVHGRQTDYLVALCWPTFALIALLAPEIVRVLLGSGWDGAVASVRILALAGLMFPFNIMSAKTFVATGHEDTYFRITAAQQVVAAMLGVIGAAISLEAFCAAIAAAAAIRAAFILRAAHRLFGAAEPGIGPVLRRGAVIAAATVSGPLALILLRETGMTGEWHGLATLLAAGPLALLGWLAGLAMMGHALLGEVRILMRDRVRART